MARPSARGSARRQAGKRWRGTEGIDVEPVAGGVVAVFARDHGLTEGGEVSDFLFVLLEEHQSVVIDLQHATFIDSSFIHALAMAAAVARAHGRELSLRLDEESAVYRSLEMCSFVGLPLIAPRTGSRSHA
jgi:STAS domain-containing protein